MTKILSNGSHWMGEKPDPIESLIDTLGKYALDRTFEKYGNFIQTDPQWVRAIQGPSGYLTRWEDCDHYPGLKVTVISGNFLKISHCFNIHTDDVELIARLRTAIDANKLRADYLSQPKPETQTAQEAA